MSSLLKSPVSVASSVIIPTATGGLKVAQKIASAAVDVGVKLINPFTAADDVISQNIIGIHDSQAVRHDVDYLYNVVTNIVQSSTHIGDSLDLKHNKPIQLVEDKVPQSGFKPSYGMLKEIACQMTCKPFNSASAHESVVGILEKLRGYTWDVKAVIALTAFALDYGETWRLSLMQASKENALELHVFRLEDEEKSSKANADLISTLVDRTLRLIDGIIRLEKLIANKSYTKKDVPALFNAPRDLYTYWTILALLACANQMAQLEKNFKSEVVGRLKIVLTQLNADLDEIDIQIAALDDLSWRRAVFQTPSGILELLKALIFPKDVKQLDIFDNTTKELVNVDVLKTKNLLLFISGLDNIEDEIWALKPIHEALTKDKDKQDYKILWVPVVDKWGNEEKEKFEHLKSLMPWYVVQYFSQVKGIIPLQEEWNYNGKPIVVVTNTLGSEINKSALHLIFVWGISAFPFTSEVEESLSQHWNWFWTEAFKIHPDIQTWVRENKYVFIYGGTDITWTQRFGNVVEGIKKDPIMKQADTYIEQVNLAKVDATLQTKFWLNITNSFLSKIQKPDFNLDSTIKDIQTVISMSSEKGWALVSKGQNVLVVGYNELMMSVVEGFESWRNNVLELEGFDNALKEYYENVSAIIPYPCIHFQLENIRSGVPTTIDCSNPNCGLKMEIASVNYKCCHGMHYDHANENGEAQTPV